MPNFCSSIELAELAGDRFRDFVGNHFERGREGVSGADGARQGVDGFREKFLEFLEALVASIRSIGIGQHEADQHGHPCDFDALARGHTPGMWQALRSSIDRFRENFRRAVAIPACASIF